MNNDDSAPATSERPTLDLRPAPTTTDRPTIELRRPHKRAPSDTEYMIVPARARTLEMPVEVIDDLRALSRIA